MKLTIKVCGADGAVKASAQGSDSVQLVYGAAYAQGDRICLDGDVPGFVVTRLEDSIPSVYGFLARQYQLPVPFGEKRLSYSPKSFYGDIHLLTARCATPQEIAAYRNLAFNPLDCHENSGLFPHTTANVETRGESVFAARNAIDGVTANWSHGDWPHQSWGVALEDGAEIRLDFGRTVNIDKAVITLRADFPHDNWWVSGTLLFSDGSSVAFPLLKTAGPQTVTFATRQVEWALLNDLIRADDPSPFPALSQIEFWGMER